MTDLDLSKLRKQERHKSASGYNYVLTRTVVPYMVSFFHHFNISPLQITLIRCIFLPFTYYFFMSENYILSGIIFLVYWILDHVDGALARAMNKPSALGAYADSFVDMLAMTIFIGLFTIKHNVIAGVISLCLITTGFVLSYHKLTYVSQKSSRPETYFLLLKYKIDLTLILGGDAHRFFLSVSLAFGLLDLYMFYLILASALEVSNLLIASVKEVSRARSWEKEWLLSRDYWNRRIEKYDDAQWTSDETFLGTFLKAGEFKKTDNVLDVGCGTGLILKAVSPLVNGVIGIDSSQPMVEKVRKENEETILLCDVRDLKRFDDASFDKVTMRMVYHHILEGRQKTLREIHRVLKTRGILVLGECVPPDKECKSLYEEFLGLKEERIVDLPREICEAMQKAGFKVHTEVLWIKNLETRKWLESNSLSKEITEEILNLHSNAPTHFREAHNMVITHDDVICDCKFVVITGTVG